MGKKMKASAAPKTTSASPAASPPPQLLDLVESFLSDHSFAKAHREFKQQREHNGWQSPPELAQNTANSSSHSLVGVFQAWETSMRDSKGSAKLQDAVKKVKDVSSSGSDSESSSDESEDVDMKDAAAQDVSSSDSSSSSESSSSSDSDSGTESKPKPSLKRARQSSSSSNSSSGSSSNSEDQRPLSKKAKTTVKVTATASDSDSDSSSSSSESEDEAPNGTSPSDSKKAESSPSSSSSSDSEWNAESEAEDVKAAKIPLPQASDSSDSNSSDSDSDSASETGPATFKKPQLPEVDKNDSDTSHTMGKTSPEFHPVSAFAPLPPDPAGKVNNRGNKGSAASKKPQPFSRIKKDIEVDPRLSSNKFNSHDWGMKAHEDLIVTRGKGFTKEKNKKKKGSYRGGFIDPNARNGVKFFDD